MKYLINTHFRAELNVGTDQPIPQLSQLMTEEEKSINAKLRTSDLDL